MQLPQSWSVSTLGGADGEGDRTTAESVPEGMVVTSWLGGTQ